MSEHLEIKGGAGEFEAAVIAVVIDRLAREEELARSSRGATKSGLPAWVRAIDHEEPRHPRERVWPD